MGDILLYKELYPVMCQVMRPFDQAEPPKEPERRRILLTKETWRLAALVVVALAIVLFAYNGIRADAPRLTQDDIDQAVAAALASATPPPPLASRVYQAARPAVVVIESYDSTQPGQTPDGEGSGVIVDQNGTILTALHVVDGAAKIDVIFYDGSHSPATILVRQPANDIAVIRPGRRPATIVPVVMGNPSMLEIGDPAVVIGNPFGLVGSLSTGVISGLNRTFNRPENGGQMKDLIQFDAPVNPGNSGGPLLNADGEVVGIVTGLVNPTKDNVFIGIGFAVPIQAASSALGPLPY